MDGQNQYQHNIGYESSFLYGQTDTQTRVHAKHKHWRTYTIWTAAFFGYDETNSTGGRTRFANDSVCAAEQMQRQSLNMWQPNNSEGYKKSGHNRGPVRIALEYRRGFWTFVSSSHYEIEALCALVFVRTIPQLQKPEKRAHVGASIVPNTRGNTGLMEKMTPRSHARHPEQNEVLSPRLSIVKSGQFVMTRPLCACSRNGGSRIIGISDRVCSSSNDLITRGPKSPRCLPFIRNPFNDNAARLYAFHMGSIIVGIFTSLKISYTSSRLYESAWYRWITWNSLI